jgi:hypothetical protein
VWGMDIVKIVKEEIERLEQTTKAVGEKQQEKEKLEEEIFSKKEEIKEMNQKVRELEEKMKNINNIIEEREKEVSKREFEIKSVEDKMVEALGKKSEIIKLNVGGKLFMSTKTTLSKSLLLKNILSKTKPQLEDCYFLDRPPEYFEEILHYLLTGIWKNEKVEKSLAFRKELELYDIGKPVESKKTTQTGNISTGTAGKETKKNTLAKIDKNLNLFKFKTNDDKTFEISKELLNKFPDSLFYKLLTTDNLIEMDGEFIVFDRTLLQVSVVLDYMKEEPLKYNQFKSIEEMVDCFQFCCIDVKVKEQESLFDENSKANQLITFPKLPQFSSIKLNEYLGILNFFGIVNLNPKIGSVTRIYFSRVIDNPKYEVIHFSELLQSETGCSLGLGLLNYFNLKYYTSFATIQGQNFIIAAERYKFDVDYFNSTTHKSSVNLKPLEDCFEELKKYHWTSSCLESINIPFTVLNGVHVFKSKLEKPFDVDSFFCSIFPDKKVMARFLDSNFQLYLENGKEKYVLTVESFIPVQIIKRAHALNKDWIFRIFDRVEYSTTNFLLLNEIDSSVQFVELFCSDLQHIEKVGNNYVVKQKFSNHVSYGTRELNEREIKENTENNKKLNALQSKCYQLSQLKNVKNL